MCFAERRKEKMVDSKNTRNQKSRNFTSVQSFQEMIPELIFYPKNQFGLNQFDKLFRILFGVQR